MFEQTRQRMNLALEMLIAQLEGLDGELDAGVAPGAMTLREQLSHLLGPEDADLPALLRTFSATNPPLVEIEPEGATYLSPARQRMTLAEYIEAPNGPQSWARTRSRWRRTCFSASKRIGWSTRRAWLR